MKPFRFVIAALVGGAICSACSSSTPPHAAIDGSVTPPGVTASPIASAGGVEAEFLSSDSVKLANTWASASIHRDGTTRPLIDVAFSVDDEAADGRDVDVHVWAGTTELSVLERPVGPLPVANTISAGGGTANASFTIDNPKKLPLTRIVVTLRGDTTTFEVSAMRPFPSGFTNLRGITLARVVS